MKKIKLGFAPTRRSIFSAPDAVKYRGLTALPILQRADSTETKRVGCGLCGHHRHQRRRTSV